jgi:hypothetical protein
MSKTGSTSMNKHLEKMMERLLLFQKANFVQNLKYGEATTRA